MKKAVLYCTCCDTLSPTLPPAALKSSLQTRAAFFEAEFIESPRLCRAEEAEKALNNARAAGATALCVAACSLSARGQEATRHLTAASGGGLPLEWADIREGCAWIHAGQQKAVVAKAADLIAMGLAALEKRNEEQQSAAARPVSAAVAEEEAATRVLVIGAGPAGLACAAALASMGVETVLAERRNAPGGMLPQLGLLFPRLTSSQALLHDLVRDMQASGADLRLETTVSALRPLAGGYSATLRGKTGEQEISAAAVVFAGGAIPVLPRGYFRYGELAGVSSQMELEVSLGKVERGEESPDTLPRQAIFLQCVAARDAANPYCSAICCSTALKNALRLRALAPDGSVTIVHRNIVTPGIQLEELYRRATDAGVFFRNHDPLSPPEPVGQSSLEGLRLRDALDGQEVLLSADSLVCSTPLKPAPGAKGLAQGLGLRLDDMGFVCGREPVLPISPHLAGVYLCGTARWPATVEQSLQQGRAAAVKAAVYLRSFSARGPQPVSGPGEQPWPLREHLPQSTPSGPLATVREEACSRCGRCAGVCPYQACRLPEQGAMRISARRCGQCGSCAAVCPTGAAHLPGKSLGLTRARIKEALGGKSL